MIGIVATLLLAMLPVLPVGTDVDYQLGGSATPGENVGIVVRDRSEEPAAELFNVCYVNGFQAQPGSRKWWRKHHWKLILKRNGRPVKDEAWNEWLFDIRKPVKRKRLAKIVGRWTRQCAADGFDAVEYDNLDSFTRSHRLIRRKHAIRYARLLVKQADAAGLPAGQKNLSGFDGTRIGYRFAVSEECGQWKECGRYHRHYGDQVLAVEYRSKAFKRTCRQYGDEWAVVLRDRDLTPGGVHRYC